MNVAAKKDPTSRVPPPPAHPGQSAGNSITVTIDSVRAAARNVSGTIERATNQLSREAAAAVQKAAK